MTGQEQKAMLGEEIDQALAEKQFLESRLLEKENMIRGMSIVYACFASAAAILGLVYPDLDFQPVSVGLTVALSLLVMALCSQKGTARAQRLHGECAALCRMRWEAEQTEAAGELRQRYLEMMASGELLSAHERRAVLHMHDRAKKTAERQLYGYERFQYWFAEIAAIVTKAIVFLAPAAGIALAAVGLL